VRLAQDRTTFGDHGADAGHRRGVGRGPADLLGGGVFRAAHGGALQAVGAAWGGDAHSDAGAEPDAVRARGGRVLGGNRFAGIK